MSSEGQRIVQELDTSDADASPGRHRATAPPARRMSVRLGLAALGVLLAGGLGVVTADALGLTEVGHATVADGPARVVPTDAAGEPRAGRTIDLHSRPSLPAPRPEAVGPVSPPEQPSPVTAVQAAPAPPLPDPARQPAPVRTVRTGDPCAAVGQTAITDRGSTAVLHGVAGQGADQVAGGLTGRGA